MLRFQEHTPLATGSVAQHLELVAETVAHTFPHGMTECHYVHLRDIAYNNNRPSYHHMCA